MKKWKLTANIRIKYGRTLTQIEAVLSFNNIKKGDLGGWIESEKSLADDAWIYQNAEAFKDSKIWGGEIWCGEIWGGEIWGGEIWGGEIWGGEIRGGVIRGGEIRGGVIRGGEIWGGEIRGGVIWCGEIRGGEIRGGVIWGGVIRVSPIFISGLRWEITITASYLRIGCQQHEHDSWSKFERTDIMPMANEAWDWWKLHKDMLMALCAEQTEANAAYLDS